MFPLLGQSPKPATLLTANAYLSFKTWFKWWFLRDDSPSPSRVGKTQLLHMPILPYPMVLITPVIVHSGVSFSPDCKFQESRNVF